MDVNIAEVLEYCEKSFPGIEWSMEGKNGVHRFTGKAKPTENYYRDLLVYELWIRPNGCYASIATGPMYVSQWVVADSDKFAQGMTYKTAIDQIRLRLEQLENLLKIALSL